MNSDAKSKIEGIIQNGYDFKFGDYISKGINLVQKDFGGFILYALVTLAVIVVVNFIPLIGAIANQFILTPALTVGAYLVAQKHDKGEKPEFGAFFKGFDHVGQLALTALTMLVIIGGSLIPFFIAIGGAGIMEWYMDLIQNPMNVGSFPSIPGWSFLLTLPAIYLGVAYSWSYMFVVFYKMGFWDAMESSRRLIGKKWFMVFLFAIVTGLIAGAGVILLCVGILVTFPAYLCMTYSAFADVTQLNKDSEAGEDIERHLVD